MENNNSQWVNQLFLLTIRGMKHQVGTWDEVRGLVALFYPSGCGEVHFFLLKNIVVKHSGFGDYPVDMNGN